MGQLEWQKWEYYLCIVRDLLGQWHPSGVVQIGHDVLPALVAGAGCSWRCVQE